MTVDNTRNRIGDPTSIAKGEYQPGHPNALPIVNDAVQQTPAAPYIPAKYAAIAGIIAALLPVVSAFIPPPFNGLAVILAFVAAVLAGVPAKVPTLLEGKRIVGPSAVPVLGSLSALAGTASETLPEGPYKYGALVVGLLLAWLTGKAFPVPVAK